MKTQTSDINGLFEVVNQLATRLSTATTPWAITGSCNLWLQGMDITPNDIDIISTKSGAYEIQSSLREFVQTPVTFRASDTIRSFYGTFNINNVRIEVMGDVENFLSGRWITHVEWLHNIILKEFDSYEVPLLSLRYEYEIIVMLNQYTRQRMLADVLGTSSNQNP